MLVGKRAVGGAARGPAAAGLGVGGEAWLWLGRLRALAYVYPSRLRNHNELHWTMDQNGAGMEAILTDVSPARLECTLHSPRHRCLLRLWSRRLAAESDGAAAAASASTSASSRGGGADGKKSAAALAAPDLSTLCAVPIGGAGNGRDGSKENGIWLMPKLFRAAHQHPIA